MNRRVLVVLGLVSLLALSGCALLTGETLEFSAEPATVTEDAYTASSYEEIDLEAQSVTETVELLGQERTIQATNYVATYERDLAITETDAAGTVVVLSTPEMSVAGQALNPIASMEPKQVLDTITATHGDISEATVSDERTATVLGEEATVTVFDAETEVAGQTVDVTVHLVQLTHEGDLVVAVGVHPAIMDHEQAGVDTMFEGIEHPVDR